MPGYAVPTMRPDRRKYLRSVAKQKWKSRVHRHKKAFVVFSQVSSRAKKYFRNSSREPLLQSRVELGNEYKLTRLHNGTLSFREGATKEKQEYRCLLYEHGQADYAQQPVSVQSAK